jgi:hypothetical protein
MEQSKIDRINELARKARASSLPRKNSGSGRPCIRSIATPSAAIWKRSFKTSGLRNRTERAASFENAKTINNLPRNKARTCR